MADKGVGGLGSMMGRGWLKVSAIMAANMRTSVRTSGGSTKAVMSLCLLETRPSELDRDLI